MPTSRATRRTRPVRRAFDELRFFSTESRILGVYKASPLRQELARQSAVARIKGHTD